LKIDPNEADALAGDAAIYHIYYWLGWGGPETDYEAKIIGQTDRAITLDPDNLFAYATKSYRLGLTNRHNEAIGCADAGLAINPNYAPLYPARAHAETAIGRFDQAKSDMQQAMRLSPRDPFMGLWYVELGDVEIGAGRNEAATEAYQKALDRGYHYYDVFLNMAAGYALEGKMNRAKSALAEARRLNPSLTVKWYVEHTMDLPLRTEGMRKAGLPED
jgi:adenylate cyclase